MGQPPKPLRRLLQRDLLLWVGVVFLGVAALTSLGRHRLMRRVAQERVKDRLTSVNEHVELRLMEVENVGVRALACWKEGALDVKQPALGLPVLIKRLPQREISSSLVFLDAESYGLYLYWNPRADRGPIGWQAYGIRPTKGGFETALLWKGQGPYEAHPWEPLPVDLRTRPWFQQAKEESADHWLPPYVFLSPKVTGTTYVLPYRDPLGTFKGALGVDLLLTPISGHLSESRLTPGTQLLLCDSKGQSLLLPAEDSPAPLPIAADMMLKSTPDGRPFLFTFQQKDYLGLFTPVKHHQGLDWSTGMAVPIAELMRPLQPWLLAWVALMLLGFGLLIWRVWRFNAKAAVPLARLSEMAASLGKGTVPDVLECEVAELHALNGALRKAGEAIQNQQALNEQLEHSQRMELVGTLASGIAHDVNNQLVAILGQMDLASGTLPEDHPAQRHLKLGLQAGEYCAKTTRALLTFGLRAAPELTPLAVNEWLLHQSSMLSRLLGGRVQVDIHLDPLAPPILGDAVQLGQVLLNLAVNARDAMPQGGSLTLRSERDASGDALIHIEDSGTGMSPHVLEHMFEPFFTTKPPGVGTGLGLPMVFGLVRAHHGEVHVASQEGRGTRFTLRFPAWKGSLQPHASAVPSQPSAASLAGLRDLLVEDEPVVRETLEEVLMQAGAKVQVASDGTLAWEHFQQGAFDLVLSDQRMPRSTGLELYARVRASGATLPFLLMSGQSLEEAEPLCAQDKNLHVLSKPFPNEVLLRHLRRTLGLGS